MALTPQLHAELTALIERFFTVSLTDEEWALLQVHMAYCESCEKTFSARTQNEANHTGETQ